MKSRFSFLLVFGGVLFSAFAHDPNLDAAPADANAAIPLGANYAITFTLSADKTEQKAELITSRRGVSFDLVDDPEHTLRFKGELKPEENGRVTLVYNAMLITITKDSSNARQIATTSGEGAILLQFDQSMTIVRSDRQKLAVSIRPLSSPSPSPAASSAPASP
ncbi:MAG TPA: hypothetical protein VH207_16485 [Chthoniobacterales bacterium]|jgi:hypothetical protein|nr:hypothetical protein [Chthoniobacterales bacterium]